MGNRLGNIDVTKGILIIITVIGHIWQRGYVHNFIYTFHMPAFFVISGILLNYTRSYEKPYGRFLLSRIYSFGIPFLFIEALGVLTDILRHGVTLNIKGYIFNTLIFNFNDPNLWFIVDLFLVEIVFAALKKLFRKDEVICGVCLLLFLLSFVLPSGRYVSTIAGSCWYLFFFVMGFYGYSLLSQWNRPAFFSSVVFLFVVAAVFGKKVDRQVSVANLAFLLSGIAGTYAALQIGMMKFPEKIKKLFSAAGRNTIVIYGTHHILYAAVGVILGITDFASTPLWAGLIMLAVVGILEGPIIYAINRWLPFLAGKHRRRRQYSES